MKKTFDTKDSAGILSFIIESVQKYKLKKSEENRATLMAEESLLVMLDHTTDEEITVDIRYRGGKLTIRLVAKGEPFDIFESSDPMRAALMQSFADDIHIRNWRKHNSVTITAYKSRYLLLIRLATAAVLGVVLSFMLKSVLPPAVSAKIASAFMTPGKEMFMNCLNMLIPPLVFFSIASAIAGFGNTAQLGRIGGKIVGIYTMTTIFATVLGFALVELIKPYQFGVAAVSQTVPEVTMDLSFVETFMKIVPDNFVKSFLEGDTVQIIFLAVFLGLAVTAVGAKAKPFQDFINAGNEVFLKMTNMLISFMPVMVFCMLSEMILSGSGNTAGIGLPVLAGIAVYLLAIVILITFYHLLLRFLGNLKPLTFTRKYLPYLLQIMGMGSSSAAIPLNMKICDDLGVHKKVYSLSIPLGATINMDGTTVYMSVFGLLLARVYGLPITFSTYLMMVFAILMLSAGAPPVMGASIICLSALLKTLGLPVSEAITMVLGVEVVAGLVRTINNAICDMVGTLIVANQENLLDKEKYYS
ncbi:MAG: dicarboxylate/amino acid:cation symporter [Erysipelotrichaceae bacterium]|nr:dicarboxylate/amino acid:cation symporter [Erysipelotrichaceae bacterium]